MVTTCAARHVLTEIRDAEASFTLGVAAFCVNDFGIDEDQFGVRILFESDVDDGDAARDADLRRGQTHAARSIHRLEHVLDQFLQFFVKDCDCSRPVFRGPDFRILRWDRSFQLRSVVFQLLAVALEIAQGFCHGVAAEFFQSAAGQSKRDHGLGRDAGRRNHAHIGALIGRFHRFACSEIDRLQRAAQRGNRLQIATHADLLSVGNAAFNSAGIVATARESG